MARATGMAATLAFATSNRGGTLAAKFLFSLLLSLLLTGPWAA